MAKRLNFRSIIKVDAELIQIQDLDLLLERILLQARKVLHADAGTIYVKETIEENGEKIDKLKMKYSQNDTLQKELPPGQKLIYAVFSVPIFLERNIFGHSGIGLF